ncbi:MAG TPA: PEP/pyruvate-binding domain-containing protein [Candidatus Polarisedimenticolaceae bacterium]|nr:PEP/pyruvate-binding domain-containing protein [Candidatus Polarisedimenticolaceae bacterium]
MDATASRNDETFATTEPILERVAARCGRTLAQQVVAEIGSEGLNLGLTAERFIGISIDGSLPFLVTPDEAPLLEACDGARRVSDSWLFVGHGGDPARSADPTPDDALVKRFREFNLAHADVLEQIVDTAPLTRQRVMTILERMDRIVGDFIALFASHADECVILPEVHATIARRILAELDRDAAEAGRIAELSRLVQTFDDPASLGAVRTLHGLKRYLHQRGLDLGMQLVRGRQSADRTVGLAFAAEGRVVRCIKRIRYADFNPAETAPADRSIPWPVRLAIDAFGRQLLHGQEKFPHLEVFCYGNEVHYYLSFWNHPALLRVDFSPPLRGGMIDLAYYGVSNYDEAVHPNPSLDAIRLLLRGLDFDVDVEYSKIHARLDKERTIDPARLRDRAEAMLRLAPYLMDLDWTIGSLALDAEARLKVAEAWAESFRVWGVLPMYRLLTNDRRGIVVAVEHDALGEHERVWSGAGPYRDRFHPPPTEGAFAEVRAALVRVGVEVPVATDDRRPIGQLALERRLLGPLREASARGTSPEHPVERFAKMLAGGPAALADGVRAARLVPALSDSVRFETIGTLNEYEVERARIELWGRALDLFALRDSIGIARLASFAWPSGTDFPAVDAAALLCRANYLTPGAELAAHVDDRETAELAERLRRPNPRPRSTAGSGRRLLRGRQASPGVAAGRVVFATPGGAAERVDRAILVAPTVGPEDNNLIYRAAGVVTTGGGILSHAGLLAVQFGKPALIVAGRWVRDERDATALLYTVGQFDEDERMLAGCRIRIRRAPRERECRLEQGDLVVLDAGEGTLEVLGQDPLALALHQEIGRLAEVARRASETTSDRQRLSLRGDRLRTERQIARLLERLADADVARYAVRALLAGPFVPRLVCAALDNPRTGDDSRACLIEAIDEMVRRDRVTRDELQRRVPSSTSLFEILSLRLDVLDARRSLEQGLATLAACAIDHPADGARPIDELDGIVRSRLETLRAACATEIRAAAARGADFGLRHLLRQLERYDLVLRTPAERTARHRPTRAALEANDDRVRRRLAGRRVLADHESGFESVQRIGWKAANLAEIGRLCGGALVPPWFVVTQRAFDDALRSPVRERGAEADGAAPHERTLGASIAAALARREWSLEQRSRRIRQLWEHAELPHDVVAEVVAAYHRLIGEAPDAGVDADGGFVAIRSSSVEEDAETAARAGEFETYLFVRGDASVVTHLKRAWSGLWTERAIHNRAALGSSVPFPGGGIIVQRIVRARAAGVLQTVNVGKGAPNELVVNAGLGLGEGVVGGLVLADQFTVAKDTGPPGGALRFHCVIADKAERIVFNRRLGAGTVRQPTAGGERLRPALDYAELHELVRAALDLERGYGYPLDIEFAFEGSRLWILQARPVATYLSALRETLDRRPVSAKVSSRRPS